MSALTSENLRMPNPDSASEQLVSAARWRWFEFLFWGLALLCGLSMFAPMLGFNVPIIPSKMMLMSEILILGLLALSIDLCLGYAGLVTLGQGAFFGIGAYTAGLLAKYGAGVAPLSDPILGLLAAGLVAGAVGFATSFLVLRGSDLTRLMVTLGVALIVEELVNKLKDITGGSDGLQGVMSSPILGIWEFDLYGRTAFWYTLIVIFVCFWFCRRLVNSPYGYSLRAIKGNALRARAIGVPVNARLVQVYTLAAAIAGIAGGLLAQTTQFASPDMVAFHRSADSLLMVIFGGSGYLYGGLIGAVAFRVMQDILSSITPQYWLFWVGVALVLLVLFARNGIIGLFASAAARYKGAGK
ncbi:MULTISPECIES: branched-chain amino acid ABC transporter permease [unclassified Beijerinckia]|uniref:branched-chain amino acid ABC transporter permease n=1 Tax=unclassified Beijerinckia TaxID=2638183 RepID=UPI000895AEF8|nr:MULTISPECIES: branched-chain amino acid ABC transporter permease [unclassified Beijerinckia]MDH7796505.1 branched-chain amino acid transport system permease protein [Beijerinckia sp. GAS462]SEC47986.1 amino acid/amide ABC transporter membrane protein 2, HAAT family [Beijerinckia sp. 28-YEA-48]